MATPRWYVRVPLAMLLYEVACYFGGGVTLVTAYVVRGLMEGAGGGEVIDRLLTGTTWSGPKILEIALMAVGCLFFTIVGLVCIVAFAASYRRTLRRLIGLSILCGFFTGFLVCGAFCASPLLDRYFELDDTSLGHLNVFWLTLLLTLPATACVITDAWWRRRDRRSSKPAADAANS